MFTNEIISDCEKAVLDDLIRIEQEYDFIFPDEFKIFYTQYNGGKPQKREVCLQDGDWKSSTRFHGFYSVKDKFEKEKGIVLPNDYRRFITTVAASGTQPFYGLYSPVGKIPKYEIRADLKEKFPLTVRRPLNVYELTEEAYEALFERNEPNVDAGYILLCHEGCGMYSILIVNTEDAETYGTVWYYDLCNDAGLYPLIHPVTKQTMNFLDWL